MAGEAVNWSDSLFFARISSFSPGFTTVNVPSLAVRMIFPSAATGEAR